MNTNILQNTYGHSLELRPFKNVMELLSSMKDVCIMEKPSVNSGDWLVKSREQPSKGNAATGLMTLVKEIVCIYICSFSGRD